MDARFDALGLSVRELEDGSRVVVSRFGGQVLSWVAGGQERLFLSRSAASDGREPVRGGVPVCFPQFSGRGPLPKHGFARTSWWEEVPLGPADTIHLRLVENKDSLGTWPHRFALALRVTLQPQALRIHLEVKNTGEEAWSFTAALHSYLQLQELAGARLLGLKGLQAEDTLRGMVVTATDDSPDLSRSIDTVYRGVTGPLELRAPGQSLRIEQDGFADAVVWNPGEAAAAGIPDIGAGQWREFLCVEAAQVQSPVVLQPGGSWSGSQVLRVAPPQ